MTPLYSKETKAQVRDGSCLPRRSMASLRLDKNTQVQEFYYLMGELEGNKGFSLPFSCMVLPLPALPDSDGWTRLGKHGEIRKTKHWPFPFIPQLWASPAFFGDSLGLSLAPSRGEGRNVANGANSIDLFLETQG